MAMVLALLCARVIDQIVTMDEDVCDPSLVSVRRGGSHVRHQWVEVVNVLECCAIGLFSVVGMEGGIEICKLRVMVLVTPVFASSELAFGSQRLELVVIVTNVLEGLSEGHSFGIGSLAQL